MMTICAGIRNAGRAPTRIAPLASRAGRACRPAAHLYRLLLEAHADEAVHLAGKSRHGEPGAALVPVSGGRVAQGTFPDLGSVRMGRAIAHRAGPAGRGISSQLDPVP